jgi:hypothetical protein
VRRAARTPHGAAQRGGGEGRGFGLVQQGIERRPWSRLRPRRSRVSAWMPLVPS